MNIGIDIDGVIADRQKYLMECGKPIVNKDAYSLVDLFGMTKQEAVEYWYEDYLTYSNSVGVIKDACDTISKLKTDGHKIVINTARWTAEQKNERGEQMRESVRAWLAKHKIVYDELAFAGYKHENKLAIAREFNLDAHIDDALNEIELLAPHLPVIVFDMPYNKNIDLPNVQRVMNWNEIYSLIGKLHATLNQ